MPNQGGKLYVGTIQAKTFDFHSNMTLHNTNHELIASSNKNLITTIDQTFVYDCQGAQVMTFTENMRRSKHNAVERYEVEDGQENELGFTRFYYNFGGTLQIHAPNGKTLVTASSPWAIFVSNWEFRVHPDFYSEDNAISVDGAYPILLWLSEEARGPYGLGPVVGAIVSTFTMFLFCGCCICLKSLG